MFWKWVKSESTEADELRIEGAITKGCWWDDNGLTPKKFRAELEKRKGKDIVVWIDSPGGEVTAGSQIYTMLRDFDGGINVKIDGWAASIASVIAMAGDVIEMSPTAMMMIHDPWTIAIGSATDFRHEADILDEVKESIMNAYVTRTQKSRGEISDMMSAELWMSAQKAVSEGFADGILFESQGKGDDAIKNYDRRTIMNCVSFYVPENQVVTVSGADKLRAELNLLKSL